MKHDLNYIFNFQTPPPLVPNSICHLHKFSTDAQMFWSNANYYKTDAKKYYARFFQVDAHQGVEEDQSDEDELSDEDETIEQEILARLQV